MGRHGAAGVVLRVDERGQRAGGLDAGVEVQAQLAQRVQVGPEAGGARDGVDGRARAAPAGVSSVEGDLVAGGASAVTVTDVRSSILPASTASRRREPSWPRAGSPSASPPP